MAKVLIVDDSATMRKIIMRVLRQAELKVEDVLEAGNGLEGLAALGKAPDIGLILSDVNMPQMNGLEFVKKVREAHPKEKLPMVMITTEGGEAMIQQAMSNGANGYVTKPFTPESIRTALAGFIG
ncbi:MAG: response regulator [Planctomycetes bacterium]|nr:response regulator [Planctomycetota bacterium]